jgi:hypothetical protein
LLDARSEKGDQAWWNSEETALYGRGMSATVETTGLAVEALLNAGESPSIARKALQYIAAKKDASGTWGTTQATIIALRALLLSTAKGTAEARGSVEITINGQSAQKLSLSAENSDLFHLFVFKNTTLAASNQVAIHFKGEGEIGYQVAGEYFVPWAAKPVNDPLSIDIAYDRTRLAQGDLVSALATVRSRLSTTANMVMVDLGIPPGFELLSDDLDGYRIKSANRRTGRLEKLSLTPTQAILYFNSIGAGETLQLHYRLRAKYPIRARAFESRVYEYYDPDVSSAAPRWNLRSRSVDSKK